MDSIYVPNCHITRRWRLTRTDLKLKARGRSFGSCKMIEWRFCVAVRGFDDVCSFDLAPQSVAVFHADGVPWKSVSHATGFDTQRSACRRQTPQRRSRMHRPPPRRIHAWRLRSFLRAPAMPPIRHLPTYHPISSKNASSTWFSALSM